MEQKCDEERWALVDSTEASTKSPEYFYEEGYNDDDDDEALSLSDLPLIYQQSTNQANDDEQTQEDFEFGFCSLLSKGLEMCSADEVFHQGQILPFNHSVTSKKESISGSLSRSDSTDRCSSAEFTNSSRNSSISSHSSSGSSSVATTRHKLPSRIDFHSHPSPSPRIHHPKNRRGMAKVNNRVHNQSPWNIFRLGVVSAPQEIAFQDLKTRKNRANRNRSNSSSSSSSTGSHKKVGIKRRPRLFSGCSCSSDAVDTVPLKVTIIRRSANEGESEARVVEEDLVATKKRSSSHQKTFEWLKQLSLLEG